MPTFESKAESQVTKMLFLGHTGSGKTGSLASLGASGYTVRILDMDNGSEILKDFILNPRSMYRKGLSGHWTDEEAKGIEKRMSFVPLTEGMSYNKAIKKFVPTATAWEGINKLLDNWEDGEDKAGNLGLWGPRDVLVIDSLSRLADAAFAFQLKMNGRLLAKPEQGDWFLAQGLVESLLKTFYSDEVKCNIIVCAHIAYIETDAGPTRGFPQTLGKALSPKIGQYFNHALLAKTSGQGEAQKRVIVTNTSGVIELKNVAPLRVKAEYPLETGLADYFRDTRAKGA